MNRLSPHLRSYLAAIRALIVFTVLLGGLYPLAVWAVAQLPGLHDKAEGSLLYNGDTIVGSRLIGQSFTDPNGNPLAQYFQSRPSAAGNGYDPTASGAGNLGPESIVDTPTGVTSTDQAFRPSLLTTVCERGVRVGRTERVSGARPFCTPDGVGAVLALIGPRDNAGNVTRPTVVVSINQACVSNPVLFVTTWDGVAVQCAKANSLVAPTGSAPAIDYSAAQLVPVRGTAPANPAVPADAVTASGSGLDPDISSAYADLQVNRVAKARSITPAQVQTLVSAHTTGRTLGFLGEPHVNVLELNLALDNQYPVRG